VPDHIKVGAALSLSGRFAVQGEQAHRGLLLWSEHVNSAGGLIVTRADRPRPVHLIVYDDTSRRAGAAAATERLILEDRVDLLFSPYSSVLAIAAAEVAARHGRVLWNHGGSTDALDARGWQHVVTLLTAASRYFEPVLEMAVDRAVAAGRPIRTVAMVHGAAGTFPTAVVDGAVRAADRLGLAVVLRQTYPPPGEMPSLVARVAAVRPDLILGVGTTEADLAFAQEVRRQHLSPTLIGLVAAPIERFREILGPDADGSVGPSQWEPSVRDRPDVGPTSAEFAAAFRGRFGVEPDYPAAQAYAAGLIAAECVLRAGSLDDGALCRSASLLDVTTLYGRFRRNPTTGQQVGHTMVVVQWQAGQKRIVWPRAVATGTLQLPLPTAAPTSSPPGEAPS
jgi:branched-chain amino acid transport system substrate-binding protein